MLDELYRIVFQRKAYRLNRMSGLWSMLNEALTGGHIVMVGFRCRLHSHPLFGRSKVHRLRCSVKNGKCLGQVFKNTEQILRIVKKRSTSDLRRETRYMIWRSSYNGHPPTFYAFRIPGLFPLFSPFCSVF